VADITTASAGLAGRDRVRADSDTGAGYRTFPARLPVLLTALGGGFVVLGSLGVSVRASAVTRLRDDPKTIQVFMGYSQSVGWILAGLGLALAVASLAWLGRGRLLKLAPVFLTVIVGALAAGRIVSFNDRAAQWADAARRAPTFIGYHAGPGWGAWCLLLGAILAAFGLLVGVLRELDLRKGLPG